MKKTKLLNKINKYNTMLFVAIVFLWVGVLMSTNHANNQNLQRNDLSSNVKSLEDEIRLLNTTVSELQTTERLESESKRLNLVKVERNDIYYVDMPQDRVALR